MAEKSRPYARARQIFGVLFALSVCMLLLSLCIVVPLRSMPSPTPVPGGQLQSPPPTQAFYTGTLGLISLASSITSLIGLVLTTIAGWRKERREAKEADMEMRRRELDLEKLRFELERRKEGMADLERQRQELELEKLKLELENLKVENDKQNQD